MTTRLKPLALLLALVALTALALVAALSIRGAQSADAKPRVIVGLGEQRPDTFVDPRFRATGIKAVRVVASYDVVRTGGKRLAELDAYMATIKAEGLTPLVSFSASSVRSRKKKLPSVSQFVRDVKRFRARYPDVRIYGTWNEANYGTRQPTGRNPKRTAVFYKRLKRLCRGCTVLVAEYLANGTKKSKRWLKTFKKALGRGRHLWGLHNYPDPNYFTTKHTRHFLRNTRGNIWITETGGIVRFADVLLPSTKRAARALKFAFKLPRLSRRIKRIYIYNWKAHPGDDHWNSGLLSASGKERPAYYTLFRILGRTPPPAATTP